MIRSIALAVALGATLAAHAQYRPTPPSSVLLHELRKLQDVSSALYVAAHPDDENTRLIAHLANAELAETAYLSLTRGDGGQNLIGTDIREGLGVIRTQELIAARRIDGGRQFFTRANDFGYSKHPDETLTFWDRDSILNDMVWIIRKWQPDVIITRFDPESAGRTHGHHTTSAMLAVEAFDLAADRTKYPEHFEHGVEPWQAKRLLFNTSWWFYGSREAFAKADKSDLFSVDAGAYYPLLGLSNGEIAAKSRSSHASQGFGSSATRGASPEYMKFLKGEDHPDHSDVFAGIDDSWSRIEGGTSVKQVLAKAERNFDPQNPAASIPTLVEALRAMRKLPSNRYTKTKIPALEQLIADCAGVYFEATNADSVITLADDLTVAYELVAREDGVPIQVKSVGIERNTETKLDKVLSPNEALEGEFEARRVMSYHSTPYWLRGEASLGMYSVPAFEQRGLPDNPPSVEVTAKLNIAGADLTLTSPLLYRRTYPDKGEVYRPVLSLPWASARFTEQVYLWVDDTPRDVTIEVEALTKSDTLTLELELPEGWTSSPKRQEVGLESVGTRKKVSFSVTPGAAPEGELDILHAAGGAASDMPGIKVLRYPHIPYQALPTGGEARAVRLDLKRSGQRVGYVMGAGDLVPEALRTIGYEVEMLDESALATQDLSRYGAIVVGIRAYNTQDWLPRVNDRLLAYAKTGGTVVVQYNTSRRLDMAEYAPYPLKLSRKRVTVEEAPITFIDPDAEVLNRPNKLTAADFDGWVQERGLYFPEEWDEAYSPILESNDPGEEPLRGGLLVAEYGEGRYVYTGLSFFRELPAGVPGAYRLFVNLLEL